MCGNNPQVEAITSWGFTEEEVRRRWLVYLEFDPINRLFGQKEDKKAPRSTPQINPAEMMGMVENLLS